MSNQFQIAPSAAQRSRYRDLLQEDFSEDSLEETLKLLRRVLETSGFRILFDWEEPIQTGKRPPYKIPVAANDYLQEFLERSNASLPDDMPEEISERTVLERRTSEAAVLITFQSRETLTGDLGLLRDVQSLLFQNCVHVLSPRLMARGLDQANSYLLHALYAHAQLAWTDRPTHQHYLLSVLYEHAGDAEAAMNLLLASLHSSAVDDHDFLTKAQSYWSLLVEAQRVDDAKSFILELYRRASPGDLAEIQELLDQTYALEGRRAS